MTRIWSSLPMKRSLLAFAITLALGLLSMGALGMLLYYPVSPLLMAYPAASSWQGDWVWPAMIGAGMAWSFGFLFAGVLHRKLVAAHWSLWLRRACYVTVLWLWALVVWGVILMGIP